MSVLRRAFGPLLVVALLAVGASAGTYVVRPGDTLSGIANRLGVAVGALARANGITNPDRVNAGASLQLPGDASAPIGRAHLVGPGETLSAIAARYATSVRALVDLNGIRDANHVQIGRRLRIPDVPAPTGMPARLVASPARLALIPHFERWSVANGLDPALVMAVAWHESGWQNDVVSHAGAVGIGQLLPSTARFISRDLIGVPLDPAVPADNIRMTARYLRYLLSRTGGDLDHALAGYFQGLASVSSNGRLPVTNDYIAIVRVLRSRFDVA
ncbi:MAG TPA: lytic transglycosylase domain-containing protein [Acidimicrobiia bacterium]|nr:lytic transglycosylase domain-containing protein [Acidimicrobiia bacterium]